LFLIECESCYDSGPLFPHSIMSANLKRLLFLLFTRYSTPDHHHIECIEAVFSCRWKMASTLLCALSETYRPHDRVSSRFCPSWNFSLILSQKYT
jgi:hypothetical protein